MKTFCLLVVLLVAGVSARHIRQRRNLGGFENGGNYFGINPPGYGPIASYFEEAATQKFPFPDVDDRPNGIYQESYPNNIKDNNLVLQFLAGIVGALNGNFGTMQKGELLQAANIFDKD